MDYLTKNNHSHHATRCDICCVFVSFWSCNVINGLCGFSGDNVENRDHIRTWSRPHSSPDVLQDPVSDPLHLFLTLMWLSPWQPQRLIKSFAQVLVEFQLFPFFLAQQEAVDDGVELFRRHRADEALPVQAALVQQQHAEVGPGDSEYVPKTAHKIANQTSTAHCLFKLSTFHVLILLKWHTCYIIYTFVHVPR